MSKSHCRHARWLKMRAVIHPPSFVADVFANPIALGTLALWSDTRADIGLALLAICAAKTAIDGLMVTAIRGSSMRLVHTLCVPIKDLLMVAIWVYAIFSRSVEWRGIRFRIGAGSQLLPDEGNLPARVLRRLWSVEAEG